MIEELRDYLIRYGYNGEDADEIHDAYYDGGIEKAVKSFQWADDETHNYSGELLDVIEDWQKEVGEVNTSPKHICGVGYVVSDNGGVPKLCGCDELYAVRVSLSGIKKVKCLSGAIGKPLNESPCFWIVGSNKEAIQKELCRQVDHVFKIYEWDEEEKNNSKT